MEKNKPKREWVSESDGKREKFGLKIMTAHKIYAFPTS